MSTWDKDKLPVGGAGEEGMSYFPMSARGSIETYQQASVVLRCSKFTLAWTADTRHEDGIAVGATLVQGKGVWFVGGEEAS